MDFVAPGYGGGDWNLLCPRCGSEFLHQAEVTVYSRAEDDDVTVKTVVGLDGAATAALVQSSASGNPSARRHGLAIRFWCEECGDDRDHDGVELTIAQHKGVTALEWREHEK
jgi:hypothetical protein